MPGSPAPDGLKSAGADADPGLMRLLVPRTLEPAPGERVFRHGRLGPFVLLAFLSAPLLAALAFFDRLEPVLAGVAWYVWLVGSPFVLLGLLLYGLCLRAAGQVARAALLDSNWLMRVSGAGVALQLRSFQNAHFGGDVPTVLWLEPGEIACARRVRESRTQNDADGRSRVRRSWLELELRGVDTQPIAERLQAEQKERGPEWSFLGMKGRSRFGHTPVFLPRAGVLRVEWLGQGMLRELGRWIETGPEGRLDLDTDLGPGLEVRVRALLARGERIAAHELVRQEQGVSLTEAHHFVEGLERRAA